MVTKLDLMDEGTDARDILENKLLPLRRGKAARRTPGRPREDNVLSGLGGGAPAGGLGGLDGVNLEW